MSSVSPQVLIAGAGPSGLVLALTLAKNGVRVRIIEKDSNFHLGQRGPGMQPRSLELYHFLGTLPDIQKHGRPLTPRCIYKMPEGVEPLKIAHMWRPVDPTPSVPYPNPVVIGQSHNEEITRAHLAKHDIHVELNTELIGFEQDDERVTAHLVVRNGSEETRESVSVDYLVSAEGAKSVVRKELGLTFLGETRESTKMIIADINVKGLSTEYWHQWGDITTNAAYLRPTEYDGVFTLMASGKDFDPKAYLDDRERLVEFVYNATNRRDLEFGEIKWITDWRANIRMVNKFGEGRAFLVGDAGHVHSPTGGQGMNTGVQDSFNLGWKLALVLKKLAPPSLLETYNIERIPVVQEMLNVTTNLLDKTVNFKAESSDTSSFLRPKSLQQLGVNYRWSPIVFDERQEGSDAPAVIAAYQSGEVLVAGDRAPDAPGLVFDDGGETSLFDILKPSHHTALVFDPTSADTKAILALFAQAPKGTLRVVEVISSSTEVKRNAQETDSSVVTVIDRDGHAHDGYPSVALGYPIVIVRPDGIIGAIAKSASVVEKYMQSVFIQ